MAAFDQRALGAAQVALRVVLAVLVMAKPVEIYGVAVLAGIGLILVHAATSRKAAADGVGGL